jgi:transcriptional regulator with PAS, ATPase and Fis domain
MALEKAFRADLLYRINTVQLHIPPLRERAEDLLWLSRRFLDDWAANQQQPRRFLDPDAEQALLEHRWPGNVRELRHCLERAGIFAGPAGIIRADLFPEQAACAAPSTTTKPTLPDYLRQCEKRFIEHCLEVNGHAIGTTAEVLGISRKALWEKMKRLGIERPGKD